MEEAHHTKERPNEIGVVDHREDIMPPAMNSSHSGEGEEEEGVSLSTLAAVFFMGLSYVPAISTGLLLPSGILQQIGQTFGDTENILWIPGSWAIAGAVTFSAAGHLSDIFGRRYVLLSGQFFVLIGSIIGAVAHSTLALAAASSVLGWGAGIVFVGYAGIQELLPNKYRGIGIGWTEFAINIPWGCMSVYLATLLYVHASWRWIYYISIIYAAIVLVGTAIFYFPPSRPRNDYDKSRWQEFKELDFFGLLCFAAGLTVFLIGLTYLGRADYSVALVASTISIGFIVLCTAFIYDFTVARNPLFPLKLFIQFRSFTVHLIVLFVANMIWQGIITLGPQATLFMYTNDPIEIGITLLPSNFSGVLGGFILPSLVHKIKHVKYQILFAIAVQTVISASYAAVVPYNKAGWMAMQLFGQASFTWLTSLAYITTGLFVQQEDLGVSAGLLGTSRNMGGSMGNAIFSTIMTSVVNKNLANNIAAAALGAGFSPEGLGKLIPAVIENAVGVPGVLAAVPGVTPAIAAATSIAFKESYAHAFRMVFYSMIPFGVIAFAAALFVRDPSHLLNNHVAVHQEKQVLAGLGHHKEERPTSKMGAVMA